MADEPGGFLGRWARRKTDVLQGKPVQEPAVVTKPVLPDPVAAHDKPALEEVSQKPPALSLDDVKLLTKESDFKPFMAQDVGSDVRNAAMKKLFADPHFNVMDGLDIYIDDYSKSDPIPEAMLRAMTSSKFLKLFDEEEDKEKDKDGGEQVTPRETANDVAHENVAQSQEDKQGSEPPPALPLNTSQPELLNNTLTSQEDHDHPHLRLQPDHAASAPGAGRGT